VTYIQVVIGFDGLIVGADIMARKAVALPSGTGISPMVICMAVFAVGLWQLDLIQTIGVQQVIG